MKEVNVLHIFEELDMPSIMKKLNEQYTNCKETVFLSPTFLNNWLTLDKASNLPKIEKLGLASQIPILCVSLHVTVAIIFLSSITSTYNAI